MRDQKTAVRLLTLAVLLVAFLAATHAGTAAATVEQTASCSEDLDALLGAPALSGRLGPDVQLVVWKRDGLVPTGSNRALRVAVMKIRSVLTPLHPTVMDLPRRVEPSRAFDDPAVIGLVNGDLFDAFAVDASVPYAPVVTGGTIVYASPGRSRVVAWDRGVPYLREVSLAARLLLGRESSAPFSLELRAINHYSLAAGSVLYTRDWVGPTPAGAITITVADGRVARVLRPGIGLVPTAHQQVIQVPDRRTAARVSTGQSALIESRLRGASSARDVMGYSSRILRNRSVLSRCSPYTQTLRPRTALAWDRTGRRWLVVVTSGIESPSSGVRMGGVSVPTLAKWLAGIGATDAVLLDGGGSTVMLTRPLLPAHGRLPVRRDLPSSAWQRPVPVVLAVSNGTVRPLDRTE